MCSERCCRDGARYNRSRSGWFDSSVFEDWFRSCFIKHVKYHPGHHILIGDNLSSHFSEAVFELCRAHNVSFVCLPPNATHILQPLDVAYFAPMKTVWRNILRKYKDDNPHSGVLPKALFPGKVRELLEALQPKSKDNLVSGFRTTGIYPWSEVSCLSRSYKVCSRTSTTKLDQLIFQEQALSLTRLPTSKTLDSDTFNETVVAILSTSRYGTGREDPPKRRRVLAALNVPPGLSCSGSFNDSSVRSPVSDGESEHEHPTENSVQGTVSTRVDRDPRDTDPMVSDYVIVVYDTWYLGQVLERKAGDITVKYMLTIGKNK